MIGVGVGAGAYRGGYFWRKRESIEAAAPNVVVVKE